MTPREIARTIEKCLDGCDVPEANRCALVDCIEQAIERERAEALLLARSLYQLRFVAEAFADTAERAVAHHRAPKTGQQVPYHDDFANVPPSSVGRLDWWSKRFREALK